MKTHKKIYARKRLLFFLDTFEKLQKNGSDIVEPFYLQQFLTQLSFVHNRKICNTIKKELKRKKSNVSHRKNTTHKSKTVTVKNNP